MTRYLAIDLGGTKVSAALIRDNRILEQHQTATVSNSSAQRLTTTLSELLAPLIHRADKVVVASTGIIHQGQLTALNPENLGGLNQFPLVKVIEEITSLPTLALNDAQAAAWAEFNALDPKPDNMAFITISTGVGGGLVLNQKLHIGRHGLAGHIGHTLADPHGPLCGCGRVGCVEALASGSAIARQASALFNKPMQGVEVYQHYLAGHPIAERLVHQSARTIANLIADLTIIHDLEYVILGGSVGLAQHYQSLVQHYLTDLPEVYRPQLHLAHCGAQAGLLGAVAWDHYLSQQQ